MVNEYMSYMTAAQMYDALVDHDRVTGDGTIKTKPSTLLKEAHLLSALGRAATAVEMPRPAATKKAQPQSPTQRT